MNLEERLRARIRREGPISFYEWMKAALYDERDGYYCTDRVRQGRAGDYRTAPETSPLFAATLARYFAKLFAQLGSPKSLTIIEIGAGNGEFAHGVLTNLKSSHPEVFAATGYVIDEIGSASRIKALARLSDFEGRVTFQSVGGPLATGNSPKPGIADGRAEDAIIFSNELIDAMPVHRVTMRAGTLRELCVGLNEDRFFWIDCEPNQFVRDYCRRVGLNLAEGQTAEINLDAEDFMAHAAAAIERGFVVTVDYGAERDELLGPSHRFAGTLRAFHNHQLIEDVLAHPGEQDLTSTVDWTQLREAGEGAGLETIQNERLDKFLLQEGLLDLLENLVDAARDDVEALQLRTSAREMILPNGLAASFQILVQAKR